MRHQVPDLILLDMLMPAMDGPTFLKLIRRHQDWAHVPVVIMSAVADECNVRNVAALGVRDYLLKAGFSLPMLRKRIANISSRCTTRMNRRARGAGDAG